MCEKLGKLQRRGKLGNRRGRHSYCDETSEMLSSYLTYTHMLISAACLQPSTSIYNLISVNVLN